MENTYIFEGKTTNEAIEKGLKELNVSKNKVDIKVLESEEKRSFFSILAPRVVKVEMTLKENIQSTEKIHDREEKSIKKENKEKIEFNKEQIKVKLENFLNDFIGKLSDKDLTYEIDITDTDIKIDIEGGNTGYLIGYRGEVLNSLQTILTNIASKDLNSKVKVLLNIGGYREKRQKIGRAHV